MPGPLVCLWCAWILGSSGGSGCQQTSDPSPREWLAQGPGETSRASSMGPTVSL